MKATKFYFTNGQTTVYSVADTLEEATRGVASDYRFTGESWPMEYAYAPFASGFLDEFKKHTGQDSWQTKALHKEYSLSGFILFNPENENSPRFEFSSTGDFVRIAYIPPNDADGRRVYEEDPIPAIQISMNKPVHRIAADFFRRIWLQACDKHLVNVTRVRETREAKAAQVGTLEAIRRMFGREKDSWNPVQIGGTAKGWFGEAWVMDSTNVRITVDSIDSERALKILEFISKLK